MRKALYFAVILIAPMLFLSPGLAVPYAFVVFVAISIWNANAS